MRFSTICRTHVLLRSPSYLLSFTVYVIMKINFLLIVKMKQQDIKFKVLSLKLKAWLSAFSPKLHYLLLIVFFLLFAVHYSLLAAHAAEIASVDVKIQNNEIYVTTSIKPDSKFIHELNSGLSKELIFYIDLFRIWKIWPDEFVTGRRLTRILKNNPIKREHTAIGIDSNIQIEKKFKDIESMVDWGMDITDIKLINIKELEHGEYFVKVTVVSKIRKLPPVIGYLLFFIPENEFSISKNSLPFQIKSR